MRTSMKALVVGGVVVVVLAEVVLCQLSLLTSFSSICQCPRGNVRERAIKFTVADTATARLPERCHPLLGSDIEQEP